MIYIFFRDYRLYFVNCIKGLKSLITDHLISSFCLRYVVGIVCISIYLFLCIFKKITRLEYFNIQYIFRNVSKTRNCHLLKSTLQQWSLCVDSSLTKKCNVLLSMLVLLFCVFFIFFNTFFFLPFFVVFLFLFFYIEYIVKLNTNPGWYTHFQKLFANSFNSLFFEFNSFYLNLNLPLLNVRCTNEC